MSDEQNAATYVADAERALEAILLTGDRDPEVAHHDADEVLMTLLKRMGHARLVELWEAVPKWYA